MLDSESSAGFSGAYEGNTPGLVGEKLLVFSFCLVRVRIFLIYISCSSACRVDGEGTQVIISGTLMDLILIFVCGGYSTILKQKGSPWCVRCCGFNWHIYHSRTCKETNSSPLSDILSLASLSSQYYNIV